jgi:CheY-like chemotaxis protein
MGTLLKILMVDDDCDDRNFFMEAVSEINPEIECCLLTDGTEVLKFLEECQQLPDFIFLDLNLPRMDGRQCLAKLKSIKLYAGIPVIIYSTSKNPEDVEETKKLGADGFIKKPALYKDIPNEIYNVIKDKLPQADLTQTSVIKKK